MHCQHCGAHLESRSQPCLFCGRQTRVEISNPLSGMPKGWLVAAVVLIGIVSFGQFLSCSAYQPTSALRKGNLGKAQLALRKGQTAEARRLCQGEYRRMSYSGIPGSVIALSYYRDYMTGDQAALAQVGSYAREAYDREKFFLTRYVYALYLYETGDYDQAIEQVEQAQSTLIGSSLWDKFINRHKWNQALGELRKTSLAVKAGEPKRVGWNKGLDQEPAGPSFRVELSI